MRKLSNWKVNFPGGNLLNTHKQRLLIVDEKYYFGYTAIHPNILKEICSKTCVATSLKKNIFKLFGCFRGSFNICIYFSLTSLRTRSKVVEIWHVIATVLIIGSRNRNKKTICFIFIPKLANLWLNNNLNSNLNVNMWKIYFLFDLGVHIDFFKSSLSWVSFFNFVTHIFLIPSFKSSLHLFFGANLAFLRTQLLEPRIIHIMCPKHSLYSFRN